MPKFIPFLNDQRGLCRVIGHAYVRDAETNTNQYPGSTCSRCDGHSGGYFGGKPSRWEFVNHYEND